MRAKWPKVFPPLSPEQETIRNDFMRLWHQELPKTYHFVDRWNHRFVAATAPQTFLRTLDIGAGLGEHLHYEHLSPEQEANYHALDLRPNMIAELARRFPQVSGVVGDCQERLDFADGTFDRIIAIHVLEHLPNLPVALAEMHRLLSSNGRLSVVIPCEGGLAYSLARRISAQRLFEARYKQSYSWFIEREHVNRPDEIFEELARYFRVEGRRYFPIPVPVQFLNLCIGLTLCPR